MRKFLVPFVALFLAGFAVSCSDDGGSSEAFCDQVDAIESTLDADTPDAFLAALDDLIADAPSEIKGDLETLRDAYSEIADMDQSDPDAIAEATALFESPELIEATENLEAYGEEECGIEPAPDPDVSLGG